jgi:hypothetical protein
MHCLAFETYAPLKNSESLLAIDQIDRATLFCLFGSRGIGQKLK